MYERDIIHGTPRACGPVPNWQPLIDLVGDHLAGFFMAMSSTDLEDGVAAHAYKHCSTRRYLHIADDGRTFAFVAFGTYDEIDPNTAISDAFAGWETLGPQDEFDTTLAELRRAHREARDAYNTRMEQT